MSLHSKRLIEACTRQKGQTQGRADDGTQLIHSGLANSLGTSLQARPKGADEAELGKQGQEVRTNDPCAQQGADRSLYNDGNCRCGRTR